MIITRDGYRNQILETINRSPVTAILGPRQCGKTTMARWLIRDRDADYYDLEDPECPLTEERAKTVLQEHAPLIVIDEIQRQPSLFPLLRVLCDDPDYEARFLVLGSASPALMRGTSESLAGRIAFVEMQGFTVDEAAAEESSSLWLRGGFPRSFLAKDEKGSFSWRRHFITTYLERDLPQLGIRVPSPRMRRFWTMLAHYHGNIWNAAELSRSLGAKESSVRNYLDILTGSYLVRQLQPWYENLGKRLVKAPKIYFRDSGLLHALLGLENLKELQSHPKLGLSWEGWCIEQIIHITKTNNEAYFYATHGGAELDLLIFRGGRRYGFEFKYMDAPKTTKSMHSVLKDLSLEKLFVVYPGSRRYSLTDCIETLPEANIRNIDY
jgi:uncharacterized protein